MHFKLQDAILNKDLESLSESELKSLVKERLENILFAIDNSMDVYGLSDPKFGFVTKLYGGYGTVVDGIHLQAVHETKYKSDVKFTSSLLQEATEESYHNLQDYILSGETKEESSSFFVNDLGEEAKTLDQVVEIICNLEENKIKGGVLKLN